jgi:hypothetical protein
MLELSAIYSSTQYPDLLPVEGIYGLNQSVQVLCIHKGLYSIVRCECYEDDPTQWVTTCSNHWTIEYAFDWCYISHIY